MQITEQKVLLQFGRAIHDRRKALGLTQKAFCTIVGLHRTYLADIEGGRRNVSLLNICRICTALGVSVSQLFADIPTALQLSSPLYAMRQVHNTTLAPIWLAEANADHHFTFWRWHQQCGVKNHLQVFADGEDLLAALGRLSDSAVMPALLVIDLKLPGISGIDVLERFHAARAHPLPNTIATGAETSDLSARALEAGASSLLSKPFGKNRFSELMAQSPGVIMAGCKTPPAEGPDLQTSAFKKPSLGTLPKASPSGN